MRYKVIDEWTVTSCPFKSDRFVGGFACAMCEHWQSVAHHVSGARAGDPGVSEWDVGCSLEGKTECRKENFGNLGKDTSENNGSIDMSRN